MVGAMSPKRDSPAGGRRADALRSRERILRAATPLLARDPQATMADVAA